MVEIELPEGWQLISAESAEHFELELHRELSPEHVLHNVPVRALARLQQRDDFLFQVPDDCYAQVHLTWHPETNPMFPSTEIFPSLVKWRLFLEDDEIS
jgi:hypothetical protein